MESWKKFLFYVVTGLAALIALAYAGDYISIRFRIPHHREQFGSVTITRLYAIQEKANKTEYDLAPSETRTCVHSLFPQLGYAPCWYLSRHSEETINI